MSRVDSDGNGDSDRDRDRTERPIAVRNYSTRRPEMARAITNCWISLVPSKIV